MYSVYAFYIFVLYHYVVTFHISINGEGRYRDIIIIVDHVSCTVTHPAILIPILY